MGIEKIVLETEKEDPNVHCYRVLGYAGQPMEDEWKEKDSECITINYILENNSKIEIYVQAQELK